MTTTDRPNNKQLFALVAAVIVPVVLTMRLLSIWLPKPFAGALSMFVWYLAIYWIPPKPSMGAWRWLMIASLLSVAAFIVVVLGILPF